MTDTSQILPLTLLITAVFVLLMIVVGLLMYIFQLRQALDRKEQEHHDCEERIDELREVVTDSLANQNRMQRVLPANTIQTRNFTRQAILRWTLEQHFNLDEVAQLYFDIELDFEQATGGKNARIRHLVKTAVSHNLWDDLVAACQLRRKDIDWQVILPAN